MLSYYNETADSVLEDKIELAAKLDEKWWKASHKLTTEKVWGYSV